MAQNELVAAKVEALAKALAEAVLANASSPGQGDIQQIEVWLCDFAKAVRAGEFD